MRPADRRRQAGFSLLEVVAALVVLGLVFGGFASVYGTVLRQGAEPQLASQALAVADAYLAEITSRPYRDPDSGAVCAGGEGARPLFDDVCDYAGLAANGCTATSAACPALGDCACTRDGAPVDGLYGFRVAVAAAPATLAGRVGLDVQVRVRHDGLAADGVLLQSFRTDD
jgi:prepilin-type N-terminal cleavage/methylation domain-containing protein